MSHGTLASQHCVPCRGDTPALDDAAVAVHATAIPAWRVLDGRSIERTFRFRDFAAPMAFANHVAELAESEGHHPDLHVHWGRLRVELTTHAIGALTLNDFIMAARIDALATSAPAD